MLPSFIVYTALALVLALLGWHVSRREQRRLTAGGAELPFYSWEIVLSLLIFAVVAGLRWQTGYDQVMYLANYDAMKSLGMYSREDFEIGFSFITCLFAHAGAHPFFYFSFWALLQIGLIYFALRHYKALLPWLALALVLGPYFMRWMGILRQSLIECLFVALAELIVKRKFWLFLVIVLLAATIHKMSLLMLPLYFVPKIRLHWVNRRLLILVLAFCVLLSISSGWILMALQSVRAALDWMGYGYYLDVMKTNPMFSFRTLGWGPQRVALLALDVMIIWFYPSMKRHFGDNPLFRVWFMFAFIFMCYSNLMANTTFFVLRPGEIMIAFVLVMTASLLCYLFQVHRYVLGCVALALACSPLYLDLLKVHLAPTFKSYFSLYHLMGFV